MNPVAYIDRCLELAENGRGTVGINPLVGAVLVREDKIIGESWHEVFGGDHAEYSLIKNCEQNIQQGDALYISLEPCVHHGKTPPCTQSIIASGIKHVAFGMLDPNPLVAGKGIAALQAAGITATGPMSPTLCRRRNRGFVSLQEQGRPWITLKKAQTSEGRIANEDGSKLCITSDAQNRWAHTYLRSMHDAILVGVQTVVTDNPELTVRFMSKKVDQFNPLRIVLDPHLRIPLESKILREDFVQRTCLVAAEGTEIPEGIRKKGVQVLHIPFADNQFDLQALLQILQTPKEGFTGISSLLVEGGPQTWRAFLDAGLCDEEVTLVG